MLSALYSAFLIEMAHALSGIQTVSEGLDCTFEFETVC